VPASQASAGADRRAQRAVTRKRRRVERAELRRFTRRARHRRIAVAAVVGTFVTVALLVLTAVFSPLLALREITVSGTARVDAAHVREALSDQLGTPLALIDEARITTALTAFPLIRSYATELVPPHTMHVHIVERAPIGTVRTQDGAFALVDPAGVTVQESAERMPGVPLLDVPAASGPAFEAVVEVLLAMPPELLAQVDAATASTRDDVALVLTGIGQSVRWGSAEDSAQKAALLTALISVTDASSPGEFDVSAPTNGVFRPA
jgi:cell division protein FtsQ